MTHASRYLTAAALVTALALLGACGSDEDPAPGTTSTPTATEPTSESSPEPTETETEPSAEPGEAANPIQITIESGEVTPNGERLQVERGRTLHFVVTADQAGELHVHSTPEQTLSFEAGSTELELTIERPGVADMELHSPALTVLQLEVR